MPRIQPGGGSSGGGGVATVSDAAVAAQVTSGAATQAALRAVSEAGGPFLCATFGGQNSGPDELSLCVYPSVDGKNFLGSHSNPVAFSSPGMRDPSIVEVGGQFFVAVTAASFSVSQYASSIQIWTSSDPLSRNWTKLTTVDFSAQSGTSNPQVWAPKFFIDTDGSVYLYISINQVGLWVRKATDATLTAWGAATQIGSDPTNGQIDPYVVKVGSTYHLFHKRLSDLSVTHATASAPTGPFTITQTGLAWNGLNTLAAPTGAGFEGPVVVQIGDSRWRMYIDVTHVGGLYYAETSDPALASGWSAWNPCLIDGSYVSGNGRLRHGTVLRLTRPAVRAAARPNNSTPRAGAATFQRKERLTGDIPVTSINVWVVLDSSTNIVFPQCRAGDWIEVGANVLWAADPGNGGAEGHLDFATVIGSSITSHFAGSVAFGGIGQSAMFAPGATGMVKGTAIDWYQVQQADIASDGSVTIALVGKATGGGRSIYAGPTNGFIFWGRKHT